MATNKHLSKLEMLAAMARRHARRIEPFPKPVRPNCTQPPAGAKPSPGTSDASNS